MLFVFALVLKYGLTFFSGDFRFVLEVVLESVHKRGFLICRLIPRDRRIYTDRPFFLQDILPWPYLYLVTPVNRNASPCAQNSPQISQMLS